MPARGPSAPAPASAPPLPCPPARSPGAGAGAGAREVVSVSAREAQVEATGKGDKWKERLTKADAQCPAHIPPHRDGRHVSRTREGQARPRVSRQQSACQGSESSGLSARDCPCSLHPLPRGMDSAPSAALGPGCVLAAPGVSAPPPGGRRFMW